MIELITGLPGNGKTLLAISEVKAQAERENRPVFYHGIPELNIPGWELLEDPREWAKVPPRSIVLLDEAQKTFRNRSLGSVPPVYVTELETHRHLGIDLVMITQHPSLIDPAVRRLSGRHRHVIRIWGMEASTVHKWDAVKDNCDKQRADSEKTKWSFDKRVYGLYKSAEVQTVYPHACKAPAARSRGLGGGWLVRLFDGGQTTWSNECGAGNGFRHAGFRR